MELLRLLDQNTLQWFRSFWNSWLDSVMIDLSALGGRVVLTIVVVFTVGLLLALRRRRTAGFVLAAALGAMIMGRGFKVLIDRPRPEVHHPQVLIDQTRSFPSGHSMLSAVIYLTLAEIGAALIPRWRVRAYILGAALTVVFLIGVSRMYLGLHYPTDVIGGWAGGLAWGITCRWVEAHWVMRAERKAAESFSAEEPDV